MNYIALGNSVIQAAKVFGISRKVTNDQEKAQAGYIRLTSKNQLSKRS